MTAKMIDIKKWWTSERLGRAEEGTSQDYCPTNGGAVCYAIFWISIGTAMFIMAVLNE